MTKVLQNFHSTFRDYLELCKPRVVLLMLITAWVGMHLATYGEIAWGLQFYALLGIGLAAGSAAVVNHLVDQKIDAVMARTMKRPIVTGKVSVPRAIAFSVALCVISMCILVWRVNTLTALLTFITLIGYAFIYTGYLKHATPQNIVVGGLAGAAPPLLGWVAVSRHIDPQALLLVLIIFIWTPPHFWALAIYRCKEYAKAGVPMLPVTHGIRFTKISIVLYVLLLLVSTTLPYLLGMNSIMYFVISLLLGGRFLHLAVQLLRTEELGIAYQTFKYSIWYLLWLFLAMLADHYCLVAGWI